MPLSLTRRQLFRSLALVGLSACSAEGGRGPGVGRGAVGSDTTTVPALSADALLRRRLERATFGVTDALLDHVGSVGFGSWIDEQLDPGALSVDPVVAGWLSALEAPLERSAAVASEDKEASKEARNELARRTVETLTGRSLLSGALAPDQLRQRVVDVLADLLHVSSSERPALFFLADYDRLLRDGAFGRFSDLLVATAQHPAMLLYLDQATSRADGGRTPNENYAREVMELHTLGVGGGYDETDVKELAHVLTGWSIDRRTREYSFRAAWHDLGPFASGLDIVGWRPGSDDVGEGAGVAALEHLARHPATARRIAHVFARRFVSESLPADHELVEEAAELYRTHDSAIGPMVRHLLTSDRFGEAATLMLRRPIDMVAHTLRVGDVTVTADRPEVVLRPLVALMRVLGQVPYGWPAPDGFPFGSAAWSNPGAVIARWNGVLTLAAAGAAEGSRGIGVSLDPAAVGAVDPAGLAAALCGPEHQLY